jgi:predicted kinase
LIELVVFTGLQASGKTTFYQARFAASHVHVSKDAWPNARNRERRQLHLVEEALRAGRPVVVDNTNPSPLERAPLIAIAHAVSAPAVSYWFVSTVADALARNAQRAGRARVADVGVFSVAKRMVAPGRDEGFARRFEVRIADDGFAVTALA